MILETHVDSCKNRLTLCIVIRAVGDDEMMMIGSLCPVLNNALKRASIDSSEAYELCEAASWNLLYSYIDKDKDK